MRKLLGILAAVVALLAAYLLLWPVPIEPVAWQVPPAPPLEGPYAPNEYLAEAEWLGKGAGVGPEDVDVDAQGRIYGSYADGRILRFDSNGMNPEQFSDTEGRPLGLDFTADGTLVVADAFKGLLAIRSDGSIRVLSTEAGGVPYRFADDVDVGDDGAIYFSDASDKFTFGEHMEDILEHAGRGRLLRYEPIADRTTVLLEGLQFANGVAVSPGADFVLVNETGSYRVLRYWLRGDRAGQHEVFIDNLPGIPDGISTGEGGVFWLALFSPRSADLDRMADKPWMRKLALRLPEALQPKPAHHAFVLGLNANGEVIHNLQSTAAGAYAPITSVEQEGGMLYLGSLTAPAIGRVPAPGR
jgi:sugar lactone lactonase YvrE